MVLGIIATNLETQMETIPVPVQSFEFYIHTTWTKMLLHDLFKVMVVLTTSLTAGSDIELVGRLF